MDKYIQSRSFALGKGNLLHFIVCSYLVLPIILVSTLGIVAVFVGMYCTVFRSQDSRSITRPINSAALVLGGDWSRVEATTRLFEQYGTMPIMLSFSNQETRRALDFFAHEGIDPSQIYNDCQAVDTITNFTTTLRFFKSNNISDVYIVTDKSHMPRAKQIGSYILGFYGIRTHEFPSNVVPRDPDPEWWLRNLRDRFRATLWVLTGIGFTPAPENLSWWLSLPTVGDNCRWPKSESGQKGADFKLKSRRALPGT